jgi:shikimate dehydrogenase
MFAAVAEMRSGGYTGANITYPYKQIAAEALARPSKLVRKIHSANTLRFGPQIVADSTDGAGFLHALRRKSTETFAGYDLVLIGAGGAARAILWQLRELPFASITVASRTTENARRAASLVKDARAIGIDRVTRGSNPALVVQATPVGQESTENILSSYEWRATDVAVDLVYRPIETAFVKSAKSARATTIDGLGMLIEQAALSQMIWLTGTVPTHSPLSERQFHLLHDQLTPQVLR